MAHEHNNKDKLPVVTLTFHNNKICQTKLTVLFCHGNCNLFLSFLFCFVTFKENPTKDTTWAWKHSECGTISVCRLPVNVLPELIKQMHFLASNLSSARCSPVGSFFANKDQKTVGSMSTLACCWVCRQPVSVTPKTESNIDFEQTWAQTDKKLLWTYSLLIPIDTTQICHGLFSL